MTSRRRLAAILAVDVAGSRLMGEDEAGTARAVREHREAARPIVAGHDGRIVKTMGDGLLLEFPSVVAAVECAIAVQKLMVDRNAKVSEEKRIVYRMGIHLGDVLIEDEDIIGEGVLGLALVLSYSYRHEEALQISQAIIAERPSWLQAYVVAIGSLFRLGRLDEAHAFKDKLLQLSPAFTISNFYRNIAGIDEERRRRFVETFRALGVPD
jgi:tetratricopeptide (TPR) repeat protein